MISHLRLKAFGKINLALDVLGRKPEMPEGYNFDVCTTDALINRTKALNTRLSVVKPKERLR